MVNSALAETMVADLLALAEAAQAQPNPEHPVKRGKLEAWATENPKLLGWAVGECFLAIFLLCLVIVTMLVLSAVLFSA